MGVIISGSVLFEDGIDVRTRLNDFRTEGHDKPYTLEVILPCISIIKVDD